MLPRQLSLGFQRYLKKNPENISHTFFFSFFFYLLIWGLLCQSTEGMEVEDNLSRRRVGFLLRSQG